MRKIYKAGGILQLLTRLLPRGNTTIVIKDNTIDHDTVYYINILPIIIYQPVLRNYDKQNIRGPDPYVRRNHD